MTCRQTFSCFSVMHSGVPATTTSRALLQFLPHTGSRTDGSRKHPDAINRSSLMWSGGITDAHYRGIIVHCTPRNKCFSALRTQDCPRQSCFWPFNCSYMASVPSFQAFSRVHLGWSIVTCPMDERTKEQRRANLCWAISPFWKTLKLKTPHNIWNLLQMYMRSSSF